MLHSPLMPAFTPADVAAVEHSLGRIAFALDGTVLRVNQRFLHLFDYVGWDLVGRNRSLFRAEAPAGGRVPDAIDRALDSGVPFAGEMRLARRDGTPFWAEVSCVPMTDDADAVVEIVLLVRDVTERMIAAADDAGQIAAINTSQAVIHFAMDGTILHANELFLAATGHALADIVGRHHRMFVAAEEADSAAYAAFWDSLREGRHASGEYRRVRRDGRPVWLRATYNPILDLEGRPFKIVKYAVDVTPEKQQTADFQGQIAAIDKSQCVVTFAPDGAILDANDNFLRTVGYSMEELAGRHHRMFVDPAHAHSLEYEIFWSDLAAGQHRSGEFRRIGRDGQEVWFQAIYSPVLDGDGRPFKVVKYASAVTREKLRQADHQGQIAAIHKSQSVVSFDMAGNVLDANDNFLDLTGYRLSQVRGRHHAMFVSAEERESAAYAAFWRDLAAGQYKSGEFKRLTADGREVWLQASYNPILDMNGRPFKVVKNAVDVTEQKQRQGDYEGQIAAIRKSQCVVSFAMDGTVLEANENFLALTGYDAAEVIGAHHRLFVPPALAESEEYRQFWAALREGRFTSAKYRRQARDGREIWIQASYNPIFDLNGQPCKIVKIASDITADVSLATDLSRAQAEVQHDPATGLPNRLGLRRAMREMLGVTDSELALFYLDLDHFKAINDTFGHDVGDHVLRTVSGRLQAEVGAGQVVARIGGDEFVAAAANLSREQVVDLAQRLIETVSQPIAHGDRWLQVGLSVGIALTPQDTLDEDELFRFADVALYRSKGARGTYTFYAEPSDNAAEAGRHLANDMLIAVKARQFDLACRLRTGPHGPPALLVQPRWRHPERGVLAVEGFLRIAEQSGLIVPLGDWMLREGCRIAASHPGLIVAIPIYPKQMLATHLPEMLAVALRETGLAAVRVELRLERGTARVSPDSLHADLARLRAMGVTVVMHDLGDGDSALRTRARWHSDRVVVDERLRKLLRRQHAALVEQVERLAAECPADGHWLAEIDAERRLHAFTLSPEIAPDGVAALLAELERAEREVLAA